MDTESTIESIEDVDDSQPIEEQLAVLINETEMDINEALNHVQDVRGLSTYERLEELEENHEHHEIRQTDTKMSFNVAGVFDVSLEIGDTYCFTCGEWLCEQGFEPRGTPRSKKDAEWFRGPPEEVEHTKEAAQGELERIARRVQEHHPGIDTEGGALEFIADEIEQMEADD